MWLQIDERADLLTSLSQCLRSLSVVSSEPAAWKWAILSLHNALQGAMVCHLSGTAQVGALSAKAAKDWADWHERDQLGQIGRIHEGTNELSIPQFKFATREDRPPIDRLADPMELFKRLYNESQRQEGGAGAVLEIGQAQRNSFRRLHKLRNAFAHFTPKGWSLELRGLPNIFLSVLEVLDIISADPWPFRHMEAQQRAQFVDLLANLRTVLVEISR
jgi:hypothetical protein